MTNAFKHEERYKIKIYALIDINKITRGVTQIKAEINKYKKIRTRKTGLN